MDDVGSEDGISSKGWVSIWVDDSGWVRLVVCIEEGGVIVVFWAVVKGESGVGKLEDSDSERLFDKGTSLNAPNKGTKSSLLAMVALEYVGERDGPYIP